MVDIELSTNTRLSSSLELGDLVDIEKCEPCQIEATSLRIRLVTKRDINYNQSFTTYLKEYLGKKEEN